MHVVVMGCVYQSLIKKLLTYLLTFGFGWLSSVLRPRQHSIGYMGDGTVFTGQKTQPIVWILMTKDAFYYESNTAFQLLRQ